MDVLSQNASASSSTLNPNAPMFVPSSYKAVEDFSDQWWDLVHSSPWFRDYWLQERFHDPQFDPFFPENDDPAPLLPDLDSLFDPFLVKQEEEEEEEQERGYNKDLVSLGAAKWRNARVLAEKPRYAEKAPKIVNVKVSPRPIQQPR
ncbi:hypothetical protein RHGRI_008097 [Rhododendron griersonianum]|uniref:Ataxin-2 C-terminal domain-containing protein n=1 Tax=Rhododendron griersonianum TaxID=479676 RepID=A0AAV6L2A4_9ERIC|nr:hypothetical protein RHGRI_008097 [Rhododendron griersonianum]